MADIETIARPYAQALFELALDRDALGPWSSAMEAAAAVASADEVKVQIGNPALPRETLLNMLVELIGGIRGGEEFAADQGRNLLRLLIENDRIEALPAIAEQFEALKAEQENTVTAVVTTATELSDEELGAIQRALADRLGKTVQLSTVIDKDLVGGAVIRAGDFVIDGSVSARLDRLANSLIN